MFGADLFWLTLWALIVILTASTLVGRAWCSFFPYKLRPVAKFFLAPSLGLATLTIIASIIGRQISLGNFSVVFLVLLTTVGFSLLREKNIEKAFYHVLIVVLFCIACGATLLVPLYVYGGFNAHNDAFTYLAHSDWLQQHAFQETILPNEITPVNTQILMYQGGLRMGASFLMAFFQSFLRLNWAYEIYSALVIAAMSTCCLAIGFPLVKIFRQLPRWAQLVLLLLPAFGLGGLVFGASYGFLAQTVGLCFGAAFLFAIGPVLKAMGSKRTGSKRVLTFAIPQALLFAGAVYSYSELMPFLVLSVFISSLIMLIYVQNKKQFCMYLVALFIISLSLLNTEILRVIPALRNQAGAIVGGPVDWSLLSFFAHAIGLHSGAWDSHYWYSLHNKPFLIFMLIGIITPLLMMRTQKFKKAILDGYFLTSMVILIIFSCALVYFRYYVPSPFPSGTGQSWSQFKLTEWAYPFTMVIILSSLAWICIHLGKLSLKVLALASIIAFCNAGESGLTRMKYFMHSNPGVDNLGQYYLDLRQTVLTTCLPNSKIYLNLGGEHLKFRQMAALFLSDRKVVSDWKDDGYIFSNLPLEARAVDLQVGDCLVEPILGEGLLDNGSIIGPVRVGQFQENGQVSYTMITGGYDKESDSKNWWWWVEHKIVFKLQPYGISKKDTKTHLQFEYLARNKMFLTLILKNKNGEQENILLEGNGALQSYDNVFAFSPDTISEISIESDGIPIPLGEADSRKATFMLRNLHVRSKHLIKE